LIALQKNIRKWQISMLELGTHDNKYSNVKYKYKYLTFVFEYYSSTSTSTKYYITAAAVAYKADRYSFVWNSRGRC